MIVVRAEQCRTENKFLVQDRLRYESLPQSYFVSLDTVSSVRLSVKQSALETWTRRRAEISRPKNVRIAAEVHSNPKEVSIY
jgi:hypothetical protein